MATSSQNGMCWISIAIISKKLAQLPFLAFTINEYLISFVGIKVHNDIDLLLSKIDFKECLGKTPEITG